MQQIQKRVDQRRQELNWGVPLAELPVYEWDDYVAEVTQRGRPLLATSGVIYDVAGFADKHPGGQALIRSWVGKDATAAFHGGIYEHSNAARNLTLRMRWGVVRGGGEVKDHYG